MRHFYLNPLTKSRIAIRDLAHNLKIRIENHDMKMLNRMDTLETFPVLEPDHLKLHVSIEVEKEDDDG